MLCVAIDFDIAVFFSSKKENEKDNITSTIQQKTHEDIYLKPISIRMALGNALINQ